MHLQYADELGRLHRINAPAIVGVYESHWYINGTEVFPDKFTENDIVVMYVIFQGMFICHK